MGRDVIADHEGCVLVVEEELTDGSRVYDVEIIDRTTDQRVVWGCADEEQAVDLWYELIKYGAPTIRRAS